MRALFKTPEYERKKVAMESYYSQFAVPGDEEQIYNLQTAIDNSTEDLDEEFTREI